MAVTKANKKISMKIRLVIDSFLLCLFFFDFGMLFTGERMHNRAGIIAFMLILVHVYAGRAWFFSLVKKRSKTRQWLPLLLNFSLAFVTLLLFASGFVLLFIKEAGMIVRQVHITTAYWGLLLLGAHFGLYWERIRLFVFPLRNVFYALFLVFIHAVALYGVFACFEINLFEKLFFKDSFEFWDYSRPPFMFFLLRISLFCLSALLIRYYVFFFVQKNRVTHE